MSAPAGCYWCSYHITFSSFSQCDTLFTFLSLLAPDMCMGASGGHLQLLLCSCAWVCILYVCLCLCFCMRVCASFLLSQSIMEILQSISASLGLSQKLSTRLDPAGNRLKLGNGENRERIGMEKEAKKWGVYSKEKKETRRAGGEQVVDARLCNANKIVNPFFKWFSSFKILNMATTEVE